MCSVVTDCVTVDYPIPRGIIGLDKEENKGGTQEEDRQEVSEMRRALLSDFSENDSFNDDPTLLGVVKTEATLQEEDENSFLNLNVEELLVSEGEEEQLDHEISKELLRDLSYEDLFNEEEGEGSWVTAGRAGNIQGTVTHLSAAIAAGDFNSKLLRVKTEPNGSFEQINVKTEPKVDCYNVTTEQDQHHVIDKEGVDDHKLSRELLNDLSYKDLFDVDENHEEILAAPGDLSGENALESDYDCSDVLPEMITSTPVKKEPVKRKRRRSHDNHMMPAAVRVKTEHSSDNEDGLLNLSQQKMESFLELDDGEIVTSAEHDCDIENRLDLSQQEMESFLEVDDGEPSTVKTERYDNEDDLLNLSKQEMESFLEVDVVVKMEFDCDNSQLTLSQKEMKSFLED